MRFMRTMYGFEYVHKKGFGTHFPSADSVSDFVNGIGLVASVSPGTHSMSETK